MSEQIPSTWAEVAIGSLARVVGGGTPPSKDAANFVPPGQGVPWITPADLSGYQAQAISRGARDLSEAGLAGCGATLLPKGAVLFSSRAPIGYVAIAANEISTNQGFKSFVFPKEFDPRFAYYQLKHLKPEAEAIATGTTFKELSGAAASTLPFKVAPGPEQTRIADQLDTALARVRACDTHLRAIPLLLKRFRRAVLDSATAAPPDSAPGVKSYPDWRRTAIGAVAIDLRYGTSKKCDYTTGTTGVLRIPNIADSGRIDVSDLKGARFNQGEIEKLSLEVGDLLIIRSNGSVELVGKCGHVTEKEVGLLFAGYLIRLRVDRKLALPEFVQVWLSAPAQRKHIERTAKSTSGVNNLNAEELRSLPLRLPPLDEQTEIVRQVRQAFAFADRIEGLYETARSRTERLSPLILAKAFRGHLVPQDPNDEPANVLLARMAGQRSQVPAPRATRKLRGTRVTQEIKAMSKSRHDDDVIGQPYLARHLRRLGATSSAEALFKVAELPVADFYKQLAWEVAQGHVKDRQPLLAPGHAA